MGFGVWGLGFGVWGLGFRAYRVQRTATAGSLKKEQFYLVESNTLTTCPVVVLGTLAADYGTLQGSTKPAALSTLTLNPKP